MLSDEDNISKKHTDLYEIAMDIMSEKERENFAALAERLSEELKRKRIEREKK